MTSASSKKLKTGDDDVNIEAPSHGVPQEEEDAQVKVPSQKATIEDVEVPSNIASTAPHTASSLKKVEGDPDAEHKVCIKYASDEDFASDDDTPVNLYAVVDWELFPTGLGSINAFYRKDNSRKCFTSLREILHLGDLKVLMDSPEVNDGSDVWKHQYTWSIQSWKLYSFSGVHVLETVSGLVLHMFVDKKYPLSVNLIERMLDHQLEICHKTVVTTSRYVVPTGRVKVPTGRVKVPAGRYVVPTGKDNVIVSTGRSKVILAGRTILVLVVLCLLRVDSIVS
ncbi:hypothetical protein Tco_0891401 [Tanacetum coccineum]|uniref:Uncharacterized protein n=1 Tax=Tanacetum coccineum TaxID=301880 RepID=A0ABQ5C8A1_9ASTR